MKKNTVYYIIGGVVLFVLLYIYGAPRMPKSEQGPLALRRSVGFPQAKGGATTGKFNPKKWPWYQIGEGVKGCQNRAGWAALFGNGTLQENTNACIDLYL
jgi:hypothetical protein